ncbi:MAG: ABC transporter substrate-binding protein [Thermomicrobiales bacterium]
MPKHDHDAIRPEANRIPSPRSLNRRQLVRRSAGAAAGLAAAPVLLRYAGKSVAAQDDIPRAESSATVDGQLFVLQDQDFHPDHNDFLRSEIEAYCEVNGWDLEITEVAGFQGGGDLNQLLVGSVQAGNAPDLLIKDHQARQLHFLGVLEPTTDLVEEMVETWGEASPGMSDAAFFDDEWWGVPFFSRIGGWYARRDVLEEAGIDFDTGVATLEQRRDAALAVSDPDGQQWGWGVTVNRSGDGRSMVSYTLWAHGSTLQDETGELITFNTPETIAGLEWLRETYTAEEWAPMMPPGVNSWTDTSNNEAFLAGTLVFTSNAGTMYAKAVFDQVPFADQIIYLPNPVRISDNAFLDSIGGTKFHVIKDTKNKEATYDLIRHLMTEPVQQRIYDISRAYAAPAYRNPWSWEVLQTEDNSTRAEPVVWNEDRFTGLRWPGPSSAAVDAVGGGNYHTDMAAEVIQGKPADEVAAEYHERFVQIWKDFGLQGE